MWRRIICTDLFSINITKVQAYLFHGYWEDIGTIKSFYDANIGMTKNTPVFSFYDKKSPIYTLPRCLAPSKVSNAHVNDSVIGEGCHIKDCRILHSVIGLRSQISAGAVIEDTLLMGADYYETQEEQDAILSCGGIPVGVGKHSHVRKAIVDKNARIGEHVKIMNTDNVLEAAKELQGFYIKDGIVVILKDALIANGTVI